MMIPAIPPPPIPELLPPPIDWLLLPPDPCAGFEGNPGGEVYGGGGGAGPEFHELPSVLK